MSEFVVPEPESIRVTKSKKKKKPVKNNNLVEQEKVETKMSENVDIKYFGCGGCGINIVKAFAKNTNCDYRLIDTSKSNVDKKDKIEIIQGTGSGSGQVRAANVEAISNYINTKAFEESAPADVNVVVFSFSGGSGSVTAPLLINELHRRNKAVLAIAVMDTDTQKNFENTVNTIKSLENLCGNTKYLPMSIFSNNSEGGREKANEVILKRMNILHSFFTTDYRELDKSDKINWLRPDITLGVPGGIKGLYITDSETVDFTEGVEKFFEIDYDFHYESVMFVSSTDNQPRIKSRINYQGIDESDTFIGISGIPISEELVTFMNDYLNRYRSQQIKTQTFAFDMDEKSTTHGNGLIV